MNQVVVLVVSFISLSRYGTVAIKYYPSAISGVYPGAGGIGGGEIIGEGFGGGSPIGYGAGISGLGYGAGLKTAGYESGIGGIQRGAIGYGRNIGYGGAGPIGHVGIGAGGVGPVGISPIGLGAGAIGPVGIGAGKFDAGRFGAEGFGAGGIGAGGFGAGGIGAGGIGIGGVGLGGGGEIVNKNVYSGGQKNLNDGHYQNSYGNQGEEINQGGGGYSKGEAAVKDVKGDSAYYNDVDGGKKVYNDGKEYHGDQHFDKEGKNGLEKNIKQGHKKGHNIKGFKSYHQKDENGKTEEFYDEDHDEGGNYAFDGRFGNFGEAGASSFKGQEADGKFNADEAKKSGYYNNEHLVDNTHANQGKFGGNKFAGNKEIYGYNKGIDEQDLSGHHAQSKFYKNFPIY